MFRLVLFLKAQEPLFNHPALIAEKRTVRRKNGAVFQQSFKVRPKEAPTAHPSGGLFAKEPPRASGGDEMAYRPAPVAQRFEEAHQRHAAHVTALRGRLDGGEISRAEYAGALKAHIRDLQTGGGTELYEALREDDDAESQRIYALQDRLTQQAQAEVRTKSSADPHGDHYAKVMEPHYDTMDALNKLHSDGREAREAEIKAALHRPRTVPQADDTPERPGGTPDPDGVRRAALRLPPPPDPEAMQKHMAEEVEAHFRDTTSDYDPDAYDNMKKRHAQELEAATTKLAAWRQDALAQLGAKHPMRLAAHIVPDSLAALSPGARQTFSDGVAVFCALTEDRKVNAPPLMVLPESDGMTAGAFRQSHASQFGVDRLSITDHSDDPAVTAHEFGHWLEAYTPGLKEAAHRFWESRTHGRPFLEPDAFTGHKLELELAVTVASGGKIKDGGFMEPYTGRIYPHDDGRTPDTEIVSMGLTHLVQDPSRFAREDPEHFDFTVAALRGWPLP